jgi:DNA polymerase-1
MKLASIDPKNVYRAGALLCNYKSKPGKSAVDACRGRLEAELAALPNLNVVVAVGGFACQSLTGKTAVSKEIYNVYWNEAINAFVIPTYHPSFVFKNIEAFDDVMWAFNKAMSLVHSPRSVLDLPKVDLRIARSQNEACSLLREIAETSVPTWTAVDWETDYADPMRAPTLALGFCQRPGEAIIIPWVGEVENPDPTDFVANAEMINWLSKIAANPNVKMVFHNGDFDVRVTHYNAGVSLRLEYDTLLASYALDERGGGDDLEGGGGGLRVGSHRLKSDAKRYLGAPDWEGDIKQYLKTQNTRYSHIPRPRLHCYLGYDVHYTLLLRQTLANLLLAEEPSRHGYWTPHDRVERLLIPAQRAIIDMEIDGIIINRARAAEKQEEMADKLADLSELIRARAIELGWPQETIYQLKIRSASDLKTLIYDLMKVKVTKDLRTKLNGAPIDTEYPTGKDTLTKLRGRDPVIDHLLEYKSIATIKGTFVDGIIDRSEIDGRCHGQFALCVARTGRLASRDPNLQNLEPSTKVFYEPDDDLEQPDVFVNGDYKQLEVRVAAIYSEDPALIEATRGDIHGNIAKEIFANIYQDINDASSIAQLMLLGTKHPITAPMLEKVSRLGLVHVADFKKALRGEVRNAAKPIIFGVIYGREAFSLANGPLRCTPKEAQKYIDNLFKRFPRLAAWLDAMKQEVIDYGWIESRTGQRRRFNFMNDDAINRILKQAVNAPVQGFASDVCLQAFVNVTPKLAELGWGKPKLLVHDAIGFSLRADTLAPAMELIKFEMENAFTHPQVKLEVDFKQGPNYGEAK